MGVCGEVMVRKGSDFYEFVNGTRIFDFTRKTTNERKKK